MRLYISNGNKITKFDLPKTVEESFLVPFKMNDSQKEYTISVESEDDKWFLKSNGLVNIISNNQLSLREPLIDYNVYDLEIADIKAKVVLYATPSLEKEYKDVSIFGINNISIGNSANDNISYKNSRIINNNANIRLQNNKYILNANYMNVFLNGSMVVNAYLKIGDIIFLGGLKIIFMGNYIKVNNPNNLVFINGLQLFSSQVNSDYTNSNYTSNSDISAEKKLYNKEDYFYHIPRIINKFSEETIVIDDPPFQEKDESMPFILTIGSSLTMAMSSFMIGFSSVSNVMSGQSEIIDVLPQLIICFTMIIGSVILPRITSSYQKKQKRKREALRQKKYSEYLDEKTKEINSVLDKQSKILNYNYPSQQEYIDFILKRSKRLWERQIIDVDFLDISVGNGDTKAKLTINAPEKKFTLDEDNLQEKAIEIAKNKNLKNVPITVSLTDNRRTALICGSKNKSIYIDFILLQLITMQSAGDLKLVFLGSNTDDYEFLKYVPHVWSEEKNKRFFASDIHNQKEISEYLMEIFKERENELKSGGSDSKNDAKAYKKVIPYYLIITDSYKDIKDLPIVNKVLHDSNNYGISIMFIEDNIVDLPPECKHFIYAEDDNSYTIEPGEEENIIKRFKIPMLKKIDMKSIASILSNIPVPIKTGASELPNSLTFLEMYNASKIEQLNISNRWKTNDPTKSLKAPIGVHADGELFMLDLHEKAHGPHGLIAGSTGSGKSEFIITFILSMAINYHPDEVQFVLIDYKGGGLAGAFENREKGIKLPHLAGTITNLDNSEMNRSLVSINSELKRRQSEFNKARNELGEGTIDIYKYQKYYRQGKLKKPIAHLFIVSDEFAELKSQQPEFMDELISTARIGRSLGVHLILATQKPSGVVNDQIWSNSKFKICLKVQDKSDSMEMLKRPEAASIKETGRFYLQVGYDEYFDIGQSGYSGAQYIPTDRVIRKIDDSVSFIDELGNSYKKVNNEEKESEKKVDLGEQLTNIVKYVVDLANKDKISSKMLWLSSIPDLIYSDGLKTKYNYKSEQYYINPIIGEYDNPSNQEQGILTLDLTNVGNTAIYGMTGSGKENLLTTIIYNCCVNHSPDEINFYILDFGAETLKSFSKYPQVGGVATIEDKDMVVNLFNMIFDEFTKRKNLFSDYGGTYLDYIKLSEKKIPLIAIVINGYDVMGENFQRIQEAIFPLVREGNKYGIVFIITTSIISGIPSRVAQMFLNTISLRQKNSDSYRDIVGCPRGLIPKNYFGRGIVSKGKTGYEFQTAYISKKERIIETIKETGQTLIEKYDKKAKKIKTMPKYVTLDLIEEETTGLDHVAIGINKETLEPVFYNFDNLTTTMILANRIFDNLGFVRAVLKQMIKIKGIEVNMLDATGLFDNILIHDDIKVYKNNFNVALKNMILDINKEAQDKIKRVFVFVGLGVLKSKLSQNGLKLYDALFQNITRFKNSKIILIDDNKPFRQLQLETWYDNVVVNTNGLWLGPGVGEQNIIDFSNMTYDQKQEKFDNIAYACGRNKTIVFKYVIDEIEDDGDEREQSIS